MYTNLERQSRRFAAKATRLKQVRAALEKSLKRAPNTAELAAALKVKESELPQLETWSRTGFPRAGFRVWDISDIANPRLISHVKTGGVGVHRFDVDENYAYISTGMEGYGGNILINYDARDPARIHEVSRWWLPGQHIAGGEKPEGAFDAWHLHHAMRCGDQLWAGCFSAGLRVIDISDVGKPRTVGAYSYHPPIGDPTHTVLRVPRPLGGREVAVAIDEAHGRHHGQIPAGMWLFDVARYAMGTQGRPLRSAPVSGAHRRHAPLLRVVLRWPARGRHRRSRFAAGSRLVYSGTVRWPTESADQRRRSRYARPHLPRRPPLRVRYPGNGMTRAGLISRDRAR
jgi:hypothetical protein